MKRNLSPAIMLSCVLLLGLSSAQTVRDVRRGGLLPPAWSALHPAPTLDPAASVIDFGTMDFPASPASGAYGINDQGQIVGAYGPDLGPDIGDAGFILSKGSFKTVRFPGMPRTQCFRINKLGVVVGSYEDSAGNIHAYKLEKGTYSNIDFPGAKNSQSGGINDSGEIVGSYYDDMGNASGFTLIGNTYTSFSVPGSNYTLALGLNNSGVIAGFYADASGIYHGFTLADGTFTTVDYPGAPWSGLWDVNDAGVVVGAYGDGEYPDTFEHGFASKNGEYLNIDVPFVGVAATWVTHINKSGQIVGLYIDTDQRFYGFTAKITR
jgi:uncharacterized membrane protein